ncbi:hypothetical protein CIPAW_13G148900 [Carya illinoinensis]|uniref:Uncharacterized protein n=1 Tax=Carya illinoinensis TaxID=32201 RepID=A0A8T1NTS0_CARIL|nr:hypothetical protein CIPAW_13G148900 [Carya illinoinensis]
MYVSDLWQDAQGEVLDGNQHMLQVWETRTSYSRLFTDMYTPPLMNGEQKTAPDQAFLLTPYDAKMTNVVFEGALHYFLARCCGGRNRICDRPSHPASEIH